MQAPAMSLYLFISCIDGQDNDCDSLVDTDDPDCQGPCTPTEFPESTCDDG
jgi:hypothetical protein